MADDTRHYWHRQRPRRPPPQSPLSIGHAQRRRGPGHRETTGPAGLIGFGAAATDALPAERATAKTGCGPFLR